MNPKPELPDFRLGSENDDKNFKSCFARSVAVNSHYKQTKSLDFTKIVNGNEKHSEDMKKRQFFDKDVHAEIVRFRRNTRNHSLDDTRRLSCGNITSRRSSLICTSRIAEIPVDNFVNQSKIETLQWQLKETEKSREMYRAVMKQVVTFLEKAHHSLELLGSRLNQNNRKSSVPRSKSDHQIRIDNNNSSISSNITLKSEESIINDNTNNTNDITWTPPNKKQTQTEETTPEKLSQEAFRLLRTAQSLLSTKEPDLAHLDPPDDIEFLSQLAKEFPPLENRPQRATSFSLSPKLILPDTDQKISTAFNRKLSLQLGSAKRRGNNDNSNVEDKDKEKASSVSSVEDESGFSSMNSFQDVGLPLGNSTFIGEEVSAKSVLLRSMLHNSPDLVVPSPDHSSHLDSTLLSKTVLERTEKSPDDVKLWQKPANPPPLIPQHKRWYSSPASENSNNNNSNSGGNSMKVLWV